jgi:peptide/nickel transport system substrate-binding protein
MVAADVAATLDYLMTQATPWIGAELTRAIDTVGVLGDHTVFIITKLPYAPLLHLLAQGYMNVYPQGSLGQEAVVGTGPFVLREYQADTSFMYIRNDEYFLEGQPYLDGISMFIIRDEATR